MLSQSSLGHMPVSSWTFDKSVADVFPDMAERSIPLYRQTVVELLRTAGEIIGDRKSVRLVDIGAARGKVAKVARPILEEKGRDVSICMIEPSDAMCDLIEQDRDFDRCELFRGSFASWVSSAPDKSVDIVSCLWTAQFVPLEERDELFAGIRRVLKDDGVLLYAEKVEGQTDRFKSILRDRYESFKIDNGYSREEIEAKKQSLVGVLVPLSAPENKAMVTRHRFTLEEVLRFYNFAAWIGLPV